MPAHGGPLGSTEQSGGHWARSSVLKPLRGAAKSPSFTVFGRTGAGSGLRRAASARKLLPVGVGGVRAGVWAYYALTLYEPPFKGANNPAAFPHKSSSIGKGSAERTTTRSSTWLESLSCEGFPRFVFPPTDDYFIIKCTRRSSSAHNFELKPSNTQLTLLYLVC